jgi:hypothetical protein
MKFLNIFALCALLAIPACAQTTNSPRLPSSGGLTNDNDALAFFTRAGITNTADKARLNRLVIDLKTASLWTKLDALYPFAGGNSNACALNLVSTNWPITWHGSPTFIATGVRGNGSTAWGDTGYYQTNRSTLTNEFHLYAWAEALPGSDEGPVLANAQADAWGGVGLVDAHLGAADPNYIAGDTEYGTRGNLLAVRSDTTTFTMADRGLNTNHLAPGAIPTNSVRVLGNISSGHFPSIALDGFALATVHAASFGTSLTSHEATNYFAIMNRYVHYTLVPSSSSSHPTSSAPGLPTSETSGATTNAPQIP